MSMPGDITSGSGSNWYGANLTAFVQNGTIAESCDHERMLRSVKVPVLLTHHFRLIDEERGILLGAMSDPQAQRVLKLLGEINIPVTYRSFETMGHAMHSIAPRLYVDTLIEWATALNS